MNSQQAVVKRLTELCYQKGYSVGQLSYGSGVHPSTIKSIISGKSKNPGVVTVVKLCSALGVEVGEFFDAKEFVNLEIEEDDE